MKTQIYLTIILVGFFGNLRAQVIPIDTAHWDIQGQYVLENYRGADAIYLQGGAISLKDKKFLNGTIEYDLFLKKEQAFPGVYFRIQNETSDAEQFYVRPHQSGNADANQAAPLVKGISPWQLMFGPKYSFPYEYNYDDWTHIKIKVKDNMAQVFMDYSEEPNLSWYLTMEPKPGEISLRGGNRSGMHIANVSVDFNTPEITNFNPIEREPIEGLIGSWEISDKFEEQLLQDPSKLEEVIAARSWQGSVNIEEGTAANISRIQRRYDGKETNTVFAKITIDSKQDQLKLFEFGYSDRVVAILNGKPIYWGNNKWRSRDYRYLGTIGLFDGIYLDLKKGKNELLMAVSEDFGGWLITGKFKSIEGLKIK